MRVMKILIALAFVGILAALLFAGVAMVRDGRDGKPKTKHMANALAWRVGLSVLVFMVILLSYHMGWIKPTGLPSA
jgi:TRAP-type C4-dicarboxylate transport system permease large subunit